MAATPTATRSRPPLAARMRLLGWLQKNVHQSWLLALNRPRSCERVAGLAAKRTFTIPGPWPLVYALSVRGRERVAGVVAKRTFTVPGPWPLCLHSLSRSIFATASFMTQATYFCTADHILHNLVTCSRAHLDHCAKSESLTTCLWCMSCSLSIITKNCIATPTAPLFASIVCLADAPPPLFAGAAPSAAKLDGCERVLRKRDHRAQAR